MSGNITAGGEKGEGVAGGPADSVGADGALAFKVRGGCDGGGKGYLGSEDKAFTVSTLQDQNVFVPRIILNDQGGRVINWSYDDTAPTLRAQTKGHEPIIMNEENNTEEEAYADAVKANAGEILRVTAPINRQNREPGDPRRMLAKGNAGNAAVVYENHGQDSRIKEVEVAPQLNAKAGTGGGNLPLVQQECPAKIVPALTASGRGVERTGESRGQDPVIPCGALVRRLTPCEAEFLQGFCRNYTRIPYRGNPADECPDGPRYKALGNSWAVPCAAWIGRRIDAVDRRLREAPNESQTWTR